MSDFDAWIGREVEASDQLDEALANRWLATFDLPSADPMPQGVHFVLCTPDTRSDALGEDGHPLRDTSDASFLPPFPMPRRMWASSTIEFIAPISVGAAITRTSRVASIKEKEGGSGKLAFVDIEHVTKANAQTCVREMQTLVYREAAAPDAPLSPPEIGDDGFDASQWDSYDIMRPDERLLFRFSALTFNTHRIHYDLPYTRDVERYRGLVVHGPLTASLLLQFAARELGDNRLSRFAFRGVSPAIVGEALFLTLRQRGDGYEIGAFAGDGRQVMKADAAL